ncbi:AraC family transcriptional regulator [Acidaminobacter sp. JC074]|uniref:AraC family transcriptional regulator n=1 Tax=Acidaminobacter sp. JC074 TaxID=2530199 RepID=UPI001F0E927D|nr:AraC family transcriptional regulator [Acidaminobacter sp. JC074]MCH4886374.1 AraC family transcriptional regulator [Acidaminobacter sp. JC074]
MTYNPTLKYIQDTIDYIEDNIDSPMDADTISSHVSLSTSYLKKIFKAITDISLIEYARARKLNHCLKLLSESSMTISQIAFQNGYDYEQSFSRAFKKQFGLSPKYYRDHPKEIKITPKLDLSFIFEIKDALIVKPVFKRLPAFKIGGLRHHVTLEDKFKYKPSRLARDFHFNHKKSIQNPVRNNDYYGYTLPDPLDDMATYYYTGLKITEDSILPDRYQAIDIPEQTYIVFRFIGNFDPIDITWEHLKTIWDYRDKYLRDNPDIKKCDYGYFEYIDSRKCSKTYCEMDIYVPLNL